MERSGAGPECTEKPAAVGRHRFDLPCGHDADQLVPLQIKRAGIVGLELEPAAVEADDFAGDSIAVGQGHDISAALPVSCRSQHEDKCRRRRRARRPSAHSLGFRGGRRSPCPTAPAPQRQEHVAHRVRSPYPSVGTGLFAASWIAASAGVAVPVPAHTPGSASSATVLTSWAGSTPGARHAPTEVRSQVLVSEQAMRGMIRRCTRGTSGIPEDLRYEKPYGSRAIRGASARDFGVSPPDRRGEAVPEPRRRKKTAMIPGHQLWHATCHDGDAVAAQCRSPRRVLPGGLRECKLLQPIDRIRQRRLGLLVERTAWAFGIVCLVTCGALYIDGAAGARHELERFALLQAAALQQPPAPDLSLWDPERITAWRRALSEPAPPPLAVLRIPKIRLEVPVLRGTDDFTLNRGRGSHRRHGTAGDGWQLRNRRAPRRVLSRLERHRARRCHRARNAFEGRKSIASNGSGSSTRRTYLCSTQRPRAR